MISNALYKSFKLSFDLDKAITINFWAGEHSNYQDLRVSSVISNSPYFHVYDRASERKRRHLDSILISIPMAQRLSSFAKSTNNVK